ncbi:MAG TPA: tRNA 2-thiouridine(34) synthase MnmA [Candidatus Krumholzibacteria bacterium]|nr:tRNA 2-thiouridine(34) synthase MnmA [Candidatus Krumholzibacteria bacterium]
MRGEFLSIRDALPRNAHVLLAMSGGVDSAVSALALSEAGYRVVGLTMKNYCYGDAGAPERSCCSLEAIDDARAVCQRAGIRHMVVNTEEIFGREVYRNFLDEYRAGRTPNPCVRCNSIVRFETLIDWAQKLGFDMVATGHYARVFRADDGRRYVARSTSRAKDQSYFLSALNPAVLDCVLFPLGDREKSDVRDDARRAGLAVADKPDSQDVCFISTRTLREFLDGKVDLMEGDVETVNGDVVGRHDGVPTYTVGQRRGVGVAAGRPQYVVSVDAARNVVVVGDEPDLMRRELALRSAWMDDAAVRAAADTAALRAQIRSRHDAQPVESVELDGECVRLVFAQPQRAIAPGQTLALYDGDVVVGAGIIESSGPA